MRLSKISDEDRINKHRFNLSIYVFTVVLVLGNIGLWFINEDVSDAKDKKIDDLLTQNTQLLSDNKNIFSGNQDLFSGQKELLDENRKIAEQNKNLSEKVEELKEVVIEKDNRITELENQVSNLEIAAPKIGLDGRIEASPDVSFSSDFSDGIVKARNLFDEGKLNEAYSIAESLSKKKNDFGLAYFIMGTVKVQQTDYTNGEILLKKAINLGLTNNDKAWAYHNLGISYLRRNQLQEAQTNLRRCVEINPQMEESKKLLNEISQYLNR